MTEIKVPNVPSKQELFDKLKADFAGTYKVYFFGLKFVKVSMVRKSRFVGAEVRLDLKKNTIRVTGDFPSLLIFSIFWPITGFFEEEWKIFESEIADYIQKNYNGVIIGKK